MLLAQVAEALVIYENVKRLAWQVLPPSVDGHHHGEKLLLRGQLLVAHAQYLAELRHGVAVLYQWHQCRCHRCLSQL